MRAVPAILASIILLVTALVRPAYATAVVVYSPVANKSWQYTTLAHHGYLSENAHDVAGSSWTGSDNVAFTVSTGATGYVETAANNNCGYSGDNYVTLQLYFNNAYWGKVSYLHLRSVNVSVGQTVQSGTVLGAIQNQADACWTDVHVHMDQINGSWTTPDDTSTVHPYSVNVITYSTGIPMSPTVNPRSLTTDTSNRGPVK